MSFLKSILSFLFEAGEAQAPVTKIPPLCPSCKIALTTITLQETQIFTCEHCEGLWLTPNVFSEMLRIPEGQASPLLKSSSDGAHTFSRSPSSRICPDCDERMDNVQFHYSSDLWIDSCPNGHGIWLDGGELFLARRHSEHFQGEMTAEEKYIAASALLDGQITTNSNRAQIMSEITAEWRSRHSDVTRRHQ